MEKFGEKVRVQVPVSIDVQVTPEMFVKAIMQSETYWRKIKPMIDLARKFDAYLAIQKKAETGGKGVDEEPLETFTHYIEKIKAAMPPDKYPFILEVGAGAGDETKALMDAGYRVVGITFGEDNIKRAEEKYGIKLLEMDMHNLQFPEKYFDGAVIIHTFEHALAPHMVVGELRYVLRDGGRVYVAVPDPDAEHVKTVWHTNLLNKEQIIEIFRYWGFREISGGELQGKCDRDKYEFVFEKLPDDHPDFRHKWGYIQHIYRRR
jgi:SAM-dependent methyltransferase